MRANPCVWNAIVASHALPDFARPLARGFGALFHSRKLQRGQVSQKLAGKVSVK
jgi:hypothetical protein